MGSLSHFDVAALAKKHGCTVFAETGTGTGDSLEHAWNAAGCRFDALVSVEINPVLWRAARVRFDGYAPKLSVLLGESVEGIKDILHVFGKQNILWWLDAHFPGADYGLAGYAAEARDEVRMPLKAELELIKGRKGGGAKDLIIIDDARLFQDGPFRSGVLPDRYRSLVPAAMKGTKWIAKMWSATHDMEIDHAAEGYIVLRPKEA
jgi:hypothetical protein